MANLYSRNTCSGDCPYYDSEESDDNWFQWCKHDEAVEEKSFYVEICPISNKCIMQD